MYKILCYGAGDCFKLYHKNLNYEKVQVLAVLDKNPPVDGKFNYPIAAPYSIPIVNVEKVTDYEFDFVVIFSYNNAIEMHDYLRTLNVPTEKIIYAEMNDIVCKNYELFNDLCCDQINAYAVIDNPSLASGRILNNFSRISRTDYVRIASLELLANQIIENNVIGEVAEAGVFRGFFSSLINELFPDRKLYLFDTFEGFDERDMDDDISGTGLVTDKSGFAYREFKDTSVQLVLSSVPHPEKCIVKKGYFPDTTVGIENDVNFALVSLDMDLYAPIYEGLKWFYPRMSKGGYIIIHDYNNDSCIGVKQAVDQFRKENGVGVVPISDYCGSAIIVKQ